MAESAESYKAAGNAALQAGDTHGAVAAYTKAIELDGTNHILFSNRSAAFCTLKDYDAALHDANKAVELKPDWSKGYGRRGAALYGMQQFHEAIDAYKKGLELEPNSEPMKKSLAEVEEAHERAHQHHGRGGAGGSQLDAIGQIFSAPDVWPRIFAHPQLSQYARQPDFVEKVNAIQKNPALIQTHLSDQRIMTLLTTLLSGVAGGEASPMEVDEEAQNVARQRAREQEEASRKRAEAEAQAEKERKAAEEAARYTPEQLQAKEEKEKGNAAYKKRDFTTALEHYTRAVELDPKDITYLLNRSAVYFEMKDYEKTIAECNEAIALGRQIFAPFQSMARAYFRLGNAYNKLDRLPEAIENYEKSMTEHRTADCLAALQAAEKEKKRRDELAYQSPELAAEAKQRGNDAFKACDFPLAVKEYTEAIKRAPQDPVMYSNRAAAYNKLMVYDAAIKDCDKALELDPVFIRAFVRKGNAQFAMKEFHKAIATFEKGLKIAPEDRELQEGQMRVMQKIYENQQSGDKSAGQRALQDPEIQKILSDPLIQQVLKEFKENPAAAQNRLKDPAIAEALQKLINAGVLSVK